MTPADIKQAYFDGILSYREATNRLVYEFGWTYPQADEFFRP
jgi:hypothetical protein